MTRLLDEAMETVRVLPDALQDELAHVLLQLAGVDQPPVELTPGEDAALGVSLAEAERGEFASDTEIRAIWAKHAL
jgi:predicted transcriptional regulator